MSSWGRLGSWEHDARVLQRGAQTLPVQAGMTGLAYGMGRSYGDICLNPGGLLWQTSGLDRFIRFDPSLGRLVCEPGVLLRDIQQVMVPRGWILPVTPGTQFVTIGGAVANDVHGKNHHVAGSLGDHVKRLVLLRTDGSKIGCSPTHQPEWFQATVGGMGLTGVITEIEIQLHKIAGPWLEVETLPYENLDEFFVLADASEANWDYTVSWVDCMSRKGRGIFMRANHVATDLPAPLQARKLSIPLVPPVSLINKFSLQPFNALYFNLKKQQAGKSISHYQPFFYPLDNLLQWNRIYGPKGFYQYQSVVPREHGRDAVHAMLQEIAQARAGSFLAVLKTFGEGEPVGMMSFAQPGVTLALDFANKGDETLQLFTRLDAIVREAGGRLYAAKDARMPRELFESGYPHLDEFLSYRDPGISSALSRRLTGS